MVHARLGSRKGSPVSNDPATAPLPLAPKMRRTRRKQSLTVRGTPIVAGTSPAAPAQPFFPMSTHGEPRLTSGPILRIHVLEQSVAGKSYVWSQEPRRAPCRRSAPLRTLQHPPPPSWARICPGRCSERRMLGNLGAKTKPRAPLIIRNLMNAQYATGKRRWLTSPK